MKQWQWGMTGVLALCASLALADSANVRKLIQTKIPRLADQVESVAPANVLGLYEIYTDERQILYTDEDVNFLFAGDILDARNLRNITAERIKVLGEIKPESLPLELAMKKVKGNGKRRLVVFSDPDCPFCRKLEKEMADITDVTVYTFVYPIATLHPQAPERAESIWCSADRQKAWDDYLLRGVAPEKKHCTTPLDSVQALGKKYRINGTPTLIFADGQVVPGVMPRAELERTLGAH